MKRKAKAARAKKLTVKDLAGRKKGGVRGGAIAPPSTTSTSMPIRLTTSPKWIDPCV